MCGISFSSTVCLFKSGEISQQNVHFFVLFENLSIQSSENFQQNARFLVLFENLSIRVHPISSTKCSILYIVRKFVDPSEILQLQFDFLTCSTICGFQVK
jgi:hypothetical protein